jgi:hypothetical protein
VGEEKLPDHGRGPVQKEEKKKKEKRMVAVCLEATETMVASSCAVEIARCGGDAKEDGRDKVRASLAVPVNPNS